jgi:hypothetical protein
MEKHQESREPQELEGLEPQAGNNPAKLPAEHQASPSERRDLLPESELDRDLVFHYSREHRLARAPQSVRDLYDASPASKLGVVKALTGGTRSGIFLLVTIVVVCLFLAVLSRGLRESGGTKLGGNALTISALKFPSRVAEGLTDGGGSGVFASVDAVTYIAVTKKAGSGKVYTGPVDIAVSIYQKEGASEMPIATHKVFFTLEPEEDFRFSVPFGGQELLMVFRAEEELVTLRVKPE